MSSVNINSRDLIRLEESLELASFSIEKVRMVLQFLLGDGLSPIEDGTLPQTVCFDQMIEEMINDSRFWSGNSTDGLSIPIGCDFRNEIVYFKLGYNTADYHASVIGRPGYGKTVFLHNIICNGSLFYSPNQLQLYLIDNSSVMDFSYYKQLPHVKCLSFGKEEGDYIEVLETLEEEVNRRILMYKSLSEKSGKLIDKFETYSILSEIEIPRILLILNDFFPTYPNLRDYKVKEAFTKIMNEGRKFGVHAVFSSTTSLSDYREFITKNIVFNTDSIYSIGTNGTRLNIGEAYMNIKENGIEKIIKFRCAYTNKYQHYVDLCHNLWSR